MEEEGRQFLSPIVSNELQMLWKCLTIKKNILSRPEIQAYLYLVGKLRQEDLKFKAWLQNT